MGACLSIWDTVVTGALLAVTQSRDFYCACYIGNCPTSKTVVAIACKPFWCATRLAVLTEVSSSHVTMRYVMR